MKFNQFSILSLLLVTALVGIAIALYFEKEKHAETVKELNQFKAEAGHIEVTDPNLVHVRALQSEGHNSWQYRIYLPPEHGLVAEISMGDPADPNYYMAEFAPESGQFTVVVHDAVFRRDKMEIQTFTVKLGGTQAEPDKLKRHGIRWPRIESEKYLNKLGRYENTAHKLANFRLHDVVMTYGVDEEIPLLKVFSVRKKADGDPGVLSISFKPKSKINIETRAPF